jgi:hypothetical protein
LRGKIFIVLCNWKVGNWLGHRWFQGSDHVIRIHSATICLALVLRLHVVAQ